MLAMSEVLWRAPENRDYEAFLDKVYAHYPRLQALGVEYGFETVPVSLRTGRDSTGPTTWLTVTAAPNVRNAQLWTEHEGAIEDRKVEGDSVRFLVAEPGGQTISAGLEVNGVRKGDTTKLHVFQHLGVDAQVELANPYSEWYTAGGQQGLVDGVQGSTDFRDGRWQGYWGTDLEAVIDLGEARPIKRIASTYLQYNNAWIFLPKEVSYYVSSDAKTWSKLGTVAVADSPEAQTASMQRKEIITHTFNQQGEAKMEAMRYVKVVAKTVGRCLLYTSPSPRDA